MASSPGVDELLASAGLDPADGVQLASVARLAAIPFDPSIPLVLLASPGAGSPAPAEAEPAILPGRHARASAHAVLAALYPPGHVLRALPGGERAALETLTDAELAAGDWLVPPLLPVDNLASPHGMAAISARLRAPNGCPWDRRQTHATLRPFVLEEAYELVEKELLDEDDFRDFVFTHAATLHGGMNPDFFKGTVVESEVARLLE